MKKRHNFGFTLAEVLITLAIIGVVAAMTLPTLIQNQQKRSLEVATQKFYSNMSQAVKKYMADEGVDDLRNTPLTAHEDANGNLNTGDAEKNCEDFIQKYLKVAAICRGECFASSYVGLDGTKFGGGEGGFSSLYKNLLVLSDGAIIEIYNGNSRYPIELIVDINGKKGPNKNGYDLWTMSIFYDGSIDESGLTPECKKDNKFCIGNSPKEVRDGRFDLCKVGAYGGCFGHFLENGFKFDY